MRYIEAQCRGRALWLTFDRRACLNIFRPEDLGQRHDVVITSPRHIA